MSQCIILRRDSDYEPSECSMKFRLFYEGSFYASQGEPQDGQIDKKAGHKHALRRCFHKQLVDLWAERQQLRENPVKGKMFGHDFGRSIPLKDALEKISPEINGFRFIPVVHPAFKILCKIHVLLLRRDRPGTIFNSRDIDNRLKTLFDALKMPRDATELGAATPEAGENPLFVLLQSDDLISHVSVETDDLLGVSDIAGKDDSYARLLVEVELTPYETNWFNLGFG